MFYGAIMKKFLPFALIILSIFTFSGCAEIGVPVLSFSGEESSYNIDGDTLFNGEDIMKRNILTGEKIIETIDSAAGDYVASRPVSVVFDNTETALPQRGISAADIIFEVPVNQDCTALLAIYPSVDNLPDISNVCAERESFNQIAVGFDSICLYNGLHESAAIDAEANGFNLNSAAISGEAVPELLREKGIRLERNTSKQAFPFYYGTYLPASTDAGEVKIDFGLEMYSNFKYSPDEGIYYKFNKDKRHIDGDTDTQLSFTNIFIFETEIREIDAGGNNWLNFRGGTKYNGFYVSKGGQQRISWYKADESADIELFDENGDKLTVNTGKSYVAVVSKEHDTYYLTEDEA